MGEGGVIYLIVPRLGCAQNIRQKQITLRSTHRRVYVRGGGLRQTGQATWVGGGVGVGGGGVVGVAVA